VFLTKEGGVSLVSPNPDALREGQAAPSWVVSLRAILAVLVGYVVYSSGILAFFALSGRDRHGHHALSFLLFSAFVGALYSAFAGYLCVAMIGRRALGPAIALAVVIAIDAGLSLDYVPQGGSAWSQILTMLLFAPAAVAGGWLRLWQLKRERERAGS
jgi:hypothetical protein